MDCTELQDWLHLLHAPGVGTKTARALLDEFATPRETIAAVRAGEPLPLRLKDNSRDFLSADTPPSVVETLRWLDADPLHHLVTIEDPRYPTALQAIDDPPLLLYIHGNPAALSETMIAVVGSRNPDIDAERRATACAAALSNYGFVVVSGLAIGIDGAAHQGAVTAGAPTIAVLGCGVDICYPRTHKPLAADIIAADGMLISEYPLGTTPNAGHFPRRNRIISGLSRGVVVIAATMRSGSLITAQLALEQGRDVFAMPGAVGNPLSRGPHWLIRQGAILIESAADIAVEYGVITPDQRDAAPQPGDVTTAVPNEAQTLLQFIGFEPVAPDTIIARSQMDAAVVNAQLTALELADAIIVLPDGRIARTATTAARATY